MVSQVVAISDIIETTTKEDTYLSIFFLGEKKSILFVNNRMNRTVVKLN